MNSSDLRRLAAAVALGTLVLGSTPPVAQAQATPTVRDELPDDAKKDWDAAKELFDAGDFRGALVQYNSVFEQTKNPRVLFNVGVCWKNLNRYARAVAAWEKELTFKSKLSAAEIEKVETAIETLRPFVSTLKVTANEPGATLVISGEEVGETPFIAPVPIDVGRQEVVLKKEGFVEVKKTVDVARGKAAEVTFKLEPIKKATDIRIDVKGAPKATIFMDGTDMGPAPFEGKVPAGRHTFEARAKGFETARQTTDVIYGQPFNLTLSLVEAIEEGKVRIITGFADATIEIDGKVVGSGNWEGALPAGGHQLVVRKEGFEDYEADVAVVDDQERTLRVNLDPDRRNAWIYWTIGAVAVVAGGAVASYFVLRPSEKTPVTGTLAPGQFIAPTGRF